MFHVGQKVVCVDNEWQFKTIMYPHITIPEKGGVYTVRDVGLWDGEKNSSVVCIRLMEISNPQHCKWPDTGVRSEMQFAAWRFRPVVEKKTDISIFTRMLTPKRKELVPSVTVESVRERSAVLKQT